MPLDEKEEKKYTEIHAKAGLKAKLPEIQCFPNQFKHNYEITIYIPEFTSICPKTNLPDFGKIIIRYIPHKLCVELKSFKIYIQGYRNIGIFYENVINKIFKEFVETCKPKSALIIGKFNPRGGIRSTIKAKYPLEKN